MVAPPIRDVAPPVVNTRNATASASKLTINQSVTVEYLERKFQDMVDEFTSMLQENNLKIVFYRIK